MDPALVRAVPVLVMGLALAAYGVTILRTGQMRVRVPRPQDSETARRNAYFTGPAAQRRGALFLAIGAAMAGWAVYSVTQGV